ncbi:hypothetical protein [Nocardioides daeguensis]|uniref:Ig-like domain-containing protein n=1 Tax=Nocardioides daeguensis TaxID=908359 RepID=A0ABP6VLR3_9ACTN|nr:hypothetical protein [Nocardioides daeguensis]MBV6727429.1 hypothetical protein [Nocardioides daeguensis]MCR1775519.1 hypothetical protein [Nocardioides daeguensis]
MRATLPTAAGALTAAALLLGTAPAHAEIDPGDDFQAPLIAFDPAGNQWFQDTVTLNAAVSDPGGSVSSADYQLTGAQESSAPLGRSGGTITLGTEGVTEVTVTAIDRADNEASRIAWFGVDRGAPTVTISAPLDGARVVQHSDVALTYTCADAVSGIASCSGPAPSGTAVDTSQPGTHHVEVTATDRAGRTSTTTATYEVVTGDFTVQEPPRVTGNLQTDDLAEVTPPRTTPAATSVSYQWLRDGTPIPGATGATYQTSAADTLTRLSVRATSSRAGYADVVTTSAASYVGLNAPTYSTPVITGDLVVGGTVTASIDVTPQPYGTAWSWKVDGEVRGTGATYVIQPADAGKRLVAEATLQRAGYATRWPASEPSTPVRAAVRDLDVSAAVTGQPVVGQRLTAGLPALPEGVEAGYQWLADDVAIPGATQPSLLLGPAQAGRAIRVRVVLTSTGYEPLTTTSGATPPVARATADLVVTTSKTRPAGKARKRKVRLAVQVGATASSGTVVVTRGTKVLATATVDASGRAVVVLRKQRARATSYVVSWSGDAGTLPAVRTVRVPRR